MSDVVELAEEGRQLYRTAERDWEFHDASSAFRAFMHWIEDHFEDVVAALKVARATHNLSSDASASASDERPEPPSTPDVEAPGIQTWLDPGDDDVVLADVPWAPENILSSNRERTTIAETCERIDLLEQEVEALQRENARLKSWLVR